MQKPVVIAAMLLLFYTANSQDDASFTVKKKATEVTLEPPIDSILPNTDYVLKIGGIAPKDIDTISFTGGTVKLKGTELTIHTGKFKTNGQTYTLRIFARPHTKVLQKDFAAINYETVNMFTSIVALPPADEFYLQSNDMNEDPHSFTLNSGSKYSIQIFKTYNSLYALTPSSNYVLSIISYIVVIKCGESEEMFTIDGGQFNSELNTRVAGLTDGCSITFDKIKYMQREGSADTRMHGPITIYIKN